MAASVDKMVADQGIVGARSPQGAPNRAQSEKAENALARRIALQDKFATGVLFAIVAAICVLLFSLIAYIVVSGAGKLFDASFLTGKPEQFKEGGGIGPELLTRSICWCSRCLFRCLSRLAARFTLLSTLRRTA